MSGYRQSSFDPNAHAQPGAPMRPYNWVQWCGVGLVVIGLTLDADYFADRLGWINGRETPTAAIGSMVLGFVLVNSRRQPGTPLDELQRARNRKILIVTIIVLAIVFGAAILLEVNGVR